MLFLEQSRQLVQIDKYDALLARKGRNARWAKSRKLGRGWPLDSRAWEAVAEWAALGNWSQKRQLTGCTRAKREDKAALQE